MKIACPLLLMVPLGLLGCGQAAAPKDGNDKVQANLAKLSPEDRKLAEEQGFCAVESENRLGSMGTPYKVMVKDQPVFLCCKGCVQTALDEPDRTLAKVKELRSRTVSH